MPDIPSLSEVNAMIANTQDKKIKDLERRVAELERQVRELQRIGGLP